LNCCFHSFFLKPLSVTLPFAARFTAWGDSEPRAKAHSKPSESENRDSGERAKGDAGAVFDLAPKSRPGVGPVSSKRWGDGVRKKAKTNNPAFPFVWVLEFYLESAANQHGRASVFFPVGVTCRSLRPISATSKAVSGFSTKQSGGEKPLSAAANEKTSLPEY
jgi:hypothetical protein